MLLFTLLACTDGADPDTRVNELRVIGLVAEPPEAGPGTSVQLDAWVLQPDDQEAPVQVLMWSCTLVGPTCAEEALPISLWTSVQVAEGDVTSWGIFLPLELIDVLAVLPPDLPGLPVLVQALACEEGLCPVIDRVLAEDPRAVADLADPSSWLADLPMQGVSHAQRLLYVTGKAVEARNDNPVLFPQFQPSQLLDYSPSMRLPFEVRDNDFDGAAAYGVSTAGGFSRLGEIIERREVELEWFPPARGAKGTRLYIAFEDGLGGSAVWKGVVGQLEGGTSAGGSAAPGSAGTAGP
jgi:hypothetical protein